jgi:hypothetical protein
VVAPFASSAASLAPATSLALAAFVKSFPPFRPLLLEGLREDLVLLLLLGGLLLLLRHRALEELVQLRGVPQARGERLGRIVDHARLGRRRRRGRRRRCGAHLVGGSASGRCIA